MAKKIRILAAIPGKRPEIVEIENDLSAMQDFVDGYIEAVGLEPGVNMICNEEGRIRGMADNRPLGPYGMIKGPFFICGQKGGNFASISDRAAKKYAEMLKLPESARPKGPKA